MSTFLNNDNKLIIAFIVLLLIVCNFQNKAFAGLGLSYSNPVSHSNDLSTGPKKIHVNYTSKTIPLFWIGSIGVEARAGLGLAEADFLDTSHTPIKMKNCFSGGGNIFFKYNLFNVGVVQLYNKYSLGYECIMPFYTQGVSNQASKSCGLLYAPCCSVGLGVSITLGVLELDAGVAIGKLMSKIKTIEDQNCISPSASITKSLFNDKRLNFVLGLSINF